MGTTRSTDPAGMHELNPGKPLPGGMRNAEYWHQHQTFETPFNMRKDSDLILAQDALWAVVVGSDIVLQLERLENQFVVRAYDGSGNSLGSLGVFRHAAVAEAALPTLTTVAHMLYPNHLLMPVDITHVGDVPLEG